MASITKRGNAYLIRCYAGYTADGKQITKMMTWHPEAGMSEAKAQKEAQRQAIMFEDSIGKTPVPGTLTGWFKTFIRRNNLPDIHLHDLRHTAATLMIEEQCPITAVAGTLGHATSATTTTIYAHALQRASAKTANVMQNLFEKKKIS